MSITVILDDLATPQRLHALKVAMKQAVWVEDRGQGQVLNKEYTLLCSRLRDEVAGLHGTADPELLIALWSTAQISHAGGVEYAHTGGCTIPDDEVPI